jgi:hypothetical protein
MSNNLRPNLAYAAKDVVGEKLQCLTTCHDYRPKGCEAAHQCVYQQGHVSIHQFESHEPRETVSVAAYAAKDIGLAKLTIQDLAELREIILGVIDGGQIVTRYNSTPNPDAEWDFSDDQQRLDFANAIQKRIQDTWE